MGPLLNDISLFVEVAKTKNFSRAAAYLDMPVSTLSRRIRELEREIGVPLLKRSTRKVEVTEAGLIYFERCQHIIAEANIAHEELLTVAQQPKGRLRVSMPSSLALTYLPGVLREFSEQYPEIEYELDLSVRPIDLLVDPYDLIIRFGRQPDSGVVSRQIASISLGLYASSEYLARHGVPSAPSDLSHHQCLRASASKDDSLWELRSADQVEKVPVSGKFSINHISMLHQMALQGMGIVPLSIHTQEKKARSERLERVLPEWAFNPMPLLALFPSRMMPAKTRVFIEFVKQSLNELHG